MNRRVRRAPARDEYWEGLEVAVFTTSGHVVALSEFGGLVLRILTDHGVLTRSELEVQVVAHVKPPDGIDPTATLANTLDDMSDSGLIVYELGPE